MADRTGAAAQRASGSSFYTAMRILPKAQREAMFEIYSFCRAVDDIADEAGPAPMRRAQLDAMARRHRRALRRRGRRRSWRAWRRRCAPSICRREDFLAVIDGMEMDVVADIRAPDLATLDLYCDRVASAVGRLSVRVFGMDGRSRHRRSRIISAARCSSPTSCATSTRTPRIGRLYLPREALARGRHHQRPIPRAVLAQPGARPGLRAGRRAGARALSPRPTASWRASPRARGARAAHHGRGLRVILDSLVARGWAAPRAPVQARASAQFALICPALRVM